MSQSLKVLNTEVDRLKALYLVSRQSFRQLRKEITSNIYVDEADPSQAIELLYQGEPFVVATNSHSYLNKLKSQFPRYLRETIYVRLISAFEVFLVELLRETFVSCRELFYSDKLVQFTIREILSMQSISEAYSKIVYSELRQLTSRGFSEIAKYYKTRIKVDLMTLDIPWPRLTEAHDRRHILVHRLGKTDQAYRHRYNTTAKMVSIDENYLFNSFQIILSFAEILVAKIKQSANNANLQRKNQSHKIAEIEIKPITSMGGQVLEPLFNFDATDRIVALSDIAVNITQKEESTYLRLVGSTMSINAYLKILNRLHKGKDIEILAKRIVKAGPSGLSREEITKLAKLLPPLPWPQGIHKEVASKMGLSNTKVSRAISEILEDEELIAIVNANSRT
ncbi:hypothetical protein YTPLAS21_21350 [Candidatus Nitrosocosmicus sp.]|nr:hypothetical protein YTPLAS21_21350 [Candidatus Nitrosocosmicus sp.]